MWQEDHFQIGITPDSAKLFEYGSKNRKAETKYLRANNCHTLYSKNTLGLLSRLYNVLIELLFFVYSVFLSGQASALYAEQHQYIIQLKNLK